MLGPIFSALTGLSNSTKRLQNSANNLANVQTTGFKKGEVNSIENKSGGTRVNSITKSNIQGGLIPTNNPLDLAIKGSGFFQVSNPNGGTSFTQSVVASQPKIEWLSGSLRPNSGSHAS